MYSISYCSICTRNVYLNSAAKIKYFVPLYTYNNRILTVLIDIVTVFNYLERTCKIVRLHVPESTNQDLDRTFQEPSVVIGIRLKFLLNDVDNFDLEHVDIDEDPRWVHAALKYDFTPRSHVAPKWDLNGPTSR
ncbi:unnamed protein product [Acanthoscelides obtectus]|uniref:Uncharacterized protein n=1 Tax=Acanthoscelides obtectus TaxID=200917 RepID=A0A9P0MAS6_ACAOB|nr:unnamed protein product [Acanthoscelides obtectus]CAK1649648.1 hypothetical protein AOBTE_LOCUS16342 [Acanthoscelides obtectus]